MINLSEKDADFIASIIRNSLSDLNEAIEDCEKENKKIKDYKPSNKEESTAPGLFDMLKTVYLNKNKECLAEWNNKKQDFTKCLELLYIGSN